jgi:hypothetical protein
MSILILIIKIICSHSPNIFSLPQMSMLLVVALVAAACPLLAMAQQSEFTYYGHPSSSALGS